MKPDTRILRVIQQDAPRTAGQLLPLVYDDLRRLAARTIVERASRLLP
jgi:hypothetical protein